MFQYFRTCLHYAYGLEDGRQVVDLLMDYGASEFTMDKVRHPLLFHSVFHQQPH